MSKYLKCPESDCFGYIHGTCRILTEPIIPDCPFYKSRERHLKDRKEADKKWVRG